MLVETVPLDRGDPQRRQVGALLYLGGYRLRSQDVRFGGLSAMHIEGGQVIALSDAGTLFRFPVPRGAGDFPLSIERLSRGPGDGRRKGDRDSEALAVQGDHAWVAFEGRNSVWRYRRRDFGFEAASEPAAMSDWPSNGGSEAMLRLTDGRFLILAEGPIGTDGATPALLFEGDPAVSGAGHAELRYRPLAGYRITDAAALPDGRLLFLNRRWGLFEGFAAALTVADATALRPGALIEARELAVLGSPLTIDNFEALSVVSEDGRTILWIASDDNFNPLLQQTLLLKFELNE